MGVSIRAPEAPIILRPDEVHDLRNVVGQLRHAYELLINRQVGDMGEFANGLIAPQIRQIERILTVEGE
jgi:hypothetical protein